MKTFLTGGYIEHETKTEPRSTQDKCKVLEGESRCLPTISQDAGEERSRGSIGYKKKTSVMDTKKRRKK